MKPVLVAGGAGYVGSHTCLRLAQAGYRPVVFDDLSNGHREHVQWGPLEVGDIRDGPGWTPCWRRTNRSPCSISPPVSRSASRSRNPGKFFDNNVGGAISLIEATRRAGIEALVFSSTCATFGDPVRLPMAEDHPQNPLNPYGLSKLMVERMLSDYARYAGFRSVTLRYFNAAGADPEGRIGEWHEPESHAVPLAIETALGRRERFRSSATTTTPATARPSATMCTCSTWPTPTSCREPSAGRRRDGQLQSWNGARRDGARADRRG